jgi:DNA-directed RNA polymerase specialized sigma24 family protein
VGNFRELKEHELDGLGDEELIAYANGAREAGQIGAWRTAMGVLAFGFEDRIRFWARKVGPTHVEDLVADVLEGALQSLAKDTARFEGATPGEFGAWLRRITKFRVADHYRALEGKPKAAPLPEEHEEDEEFWGVSAAHPDHAGLVVERALVEEAFSAMKNDTHRLAIDLAGDPAMGFKGLPAKEAAAQINNQIGDKLNDPMTDGNVHAILSRFRRSLEDQADG